jgi:hypothetical protein
MHRNTKGLLLSKPAAQLLEITIMGEPKVIVGWRRVSAERQRGWRWLCRAPMHISRRSVQLQRSTIELFLAHLTETKTQHFSISPSETLETPKASSPLPIRVLLKPPPSSTSMGFNPMPCSHFIGIILIAFQEVISSTVRQSCQRPRIATIKGLCYPSSIALASDGRCIIIVKGNNSDE